MSNGQSAAARSSEGGDDLYSVILPTYNERENLPLIVCMLDRAFYSMYASCLTYVLHEPRGPIVSVECLISVLCSEIKSTRSSSWKTTPRTGPSRRQSNYRWVCVCVQWVLLYTTPAE